MKKFLLPLLFVFLISGLKCQLIAQKDGKDREKTITLKIIKIVDGKKVKLDTTFILDDDKNLHDIMVKNGIKTEFVHENDTDFDFTFETDDSVHLNAEDQHVWVSVDIDQEHKHKIKSRNKLVYIEEDGVIIEMDDEKVFIHDNEDEEHVFNIQEIEEDYEFDRDSINITKKIIIKEKAGKLKRIYKIKKNSGGKDRVFIISTDNDVNADLEDIIVEEISNGADSTEITIKKKISGQQGKKRISILRASKNKRKNIDEDAKHEKIQLVIDDVKVSDLKMLRLKRNYKRLDVKGFFIFVKDRENKMRLKFKLGTKGKTSVKVMDSGGKTIFVEELKNFEGKYSKEINVPFDEFYIQIKQNKKYYLKKVNLKYK